MSSVSRTSPMAWPSRPTERKGQYSFHHAECLALRKVQERLSWKFQRLAARNATVEYRWYQRAWYGVGPSANIASSGCGPSRLTAISTSRFTTTPVPPTRTNRTNCSALRRYLRSVSARVLLTSRTLSAALRPHLHNAHGRDVVGGRQPVASAP